MLLPAVGVAAPVLALVLWPAATVEVGGSIVVDAVSSAVLAVDVSLIVAVTSTA